MPYLNNCGAKLVALTFFFFLPRLSNRQDTLFLFNTRCETRTQRHYRCLVSHRFKFRHLLLDYCLLRYFVFSRLRLLWCVNAAQLQPFSSHHVSRTFNSFTVRLISSACFATIRVRSFNWLCNVWML